MEVLSEDPFPVLVFHDAISDDQVEMMKEKIMEEGSVRTKVILSFSKTFFRRHTCFNLQLSPGQVMYTEDSGDEGQGWVRELLIIIIIAIIIIFFFIIIIATITLRSLRIRPRRLGGSPS